MSHLSNRTNASQTLGYKELMAILDIEAKRPIVEEKRQLKLVDYSLVDGWLRYLGVNIDVFSYKNDLNQIIEKGSKIKEIIGQLTLDKIKTDNGKLVDLFNKITQYLSNEDLLEKSDFIFVFGGKNIGRIERAVELWKKKWAPKIWISGGHPIYQEYEPEALTFKKWATDDGVPENVIYTEPNSITVADNIKRSLNLMDDNRITFNKMIIVISWYAQKRAWMTMEKYLPIGTKLTNINALMEPDNQVSPTKWFETEYGINIVVNEFIKMRIHDCLVMNRLV